MARRDAGPFLTVSSASSSFLKPCDPLDAADVARICGGRLVEGTREQSVITALSSATDPKPGSLVFLQTGKPPSDVLSLSATAAILCMDSLLSALPEEPAKIVVDAPQRAFAVMGRHMYPGNLGPGRATLSEGASPDFPDARVSRLARLEDGVIVGPGAVIGDYAAIGRNSVVGANAVIADNCQIGRNCSIGPSAVIQYALIGNGVIILGGAQIGQDGFGYVLGPGGLEKIPQLGRVILQDHVEIGANTTVDRGTLVDTVIGEGTKIDNLVQIAHNVRIGRYCAIAGHTGISGSVTVGDGCLFGGRVGIADHVKIGSGVRLGAASGVMHDVPDGESWLGAPAMPAKSAMRQWAALRKIAAVDRKPK